jgi:hypothetical protein
MAAVAAVNLNDALNKAYRNVIGIAIGISVDYRARLTIWRDDFFSALDPVDQNETLIYRWITPTNHLITVFPTQVGGGTPYEQTRGSATHIAQLVTQTIFAAVRNGFTPPAPLDAALTTAFNSAWT